MSKNLGGIDRALRAAAGLALLSMLVLLDGPNRYWGLIGLVPLGTAAIGWCPAYLPFGLSTCRR